jgi:hypothetical protein
VASQVEQSNTARRVVRMKGYDDGFAGKDKQPQYAKNAEYLRSYRRGRERRLLLQSGGAEA